MTLDSDESYMLRTLRLAEQGRGAVEPNPMVGAIVVLGDRIVGEGFHRRFGSAHAEVNALDRAAEHSRGATLYVNLEPCCHHGKTPPCTDRVLASGVARVVVATLDPFPEVAGQGVEKLRAAGVQVDVGCLEGEARLLNAPFFKLIEHSLPYVHAKWAMTLDGKIATAIGDSQWISNESSRRHSHVFRGLVDAIVVGSGTALADNPSLTARPPGPRTAARVILDSMARLPITSQLARTARETPTLVATTLSAPPTSIAALRDTGCECLILPAAETTGPESPRPRVSIPHLLKEMGNRRWTNILVEGGAEALGAFLEADAIDAVRVYIAPKMIGGDASKGPIGGNGILKLDDSLRLERLETLDLDGDIFIHSRVIR